MEDQRLISRVVFTFPFFLTPAFSFKCTQSTLNFEGLGWLCPRTIARVTRPCLALVFTEIRHRVSGRLRLEGNDIALPFDTGLVLL